VNDIAVFVMCLVWSVVTVAAVAVGTVVTVVVAVVATVVVIDVAMIAPPLWLIFILPL
jgi:hypothetical protein